MPNVLITGGSGYLGGSLLAHITEHQQDFPNAKIYALVRSQEQAALTRKYYAAEPLTLDLTSQESTTETLLAHKITIIFFLIDAATPTTQTLLLHALSTIQSTLKTQTHFLHTSGAKAFSSHVNFPLSPPLSDTSPTLLRTITSLSPQNKPLTPFLQTNPKITTLSTTLSIKSYILIPCIVYGPGTGYGNQTSIQTTAIIRSALALRKVYRVDDPSTENLVWPTSHITHTTTLYAHLLSSILSGETIPSNERGFYLASDNPPTPWMDVYVAVASALFSRGLVDSPEVGVAGEKEVSEMARALGYQEGMEWMVGFSLGGRCTLVSENKEVVGWRAPEGGRAVERSWGERMEEEVRGVLAAMGRGKL